MKRTKFGTNIKQIIITEIKNKAKIIACKFHIETIVKLKAISKEKKFLYRNYLEI